MNCTGNHSAAAPCDDPECPKSKIIDLPSEQQALEPSRDNLMIAVCVTLGRVVGICIRGLETFQTILMHTAWKCGWRPGNKEVVKKLRARVLNLEVRREMLAKLRAEKELAAETERVTKRFTKTYPREGK